MKNFVKFTLLALMTGLFVACAGKEVAIPKDTTTEGIATLTIGSKVKGVMITLGSFSFDVYRDRRELVREFYNVCLKPNEKMQTFIKTRLGQNKKEKPEISLYYPDQQNKGKLSDILVCTYDEDGLLEFNGLEPPNRADYVNFDEMIEDVTNGKAFGGKRRGSDFSWKFARLIEVANIQAEVKNLVIVPPSREIDIYFGVDDVDRTTGKEGVNVFDKITVDMHKDRRELFKAVAKVCANPNNRMLSYVMEKGSIVDVFTWYKHPQGGLIKLERKLNCNYYITYDKKNINRIEVGGYMIYSGTTKRQKPGISWDTFFGNKKDEGFKIDTEKLERGANSFAVGGSAFGSALSDIFYEWTQLLDAANALHAKKVAKETKAAESAKQSPASDAQNLNEAVKASE